MELVRINSLSVSYGNVEALKNASFVINSGDFIGVIGPNGAGKSTLVKAILGAVKPTSGTVEYGVENMRIGYLPQSHTIDTLFPVSVRQAIMLGSITRKNLWHSDGKRADELMQLAGIKHLARRSLTALSGGELQRMLLCRALINDPQLLILDEPTTYVDNKFESELYDLLVKLNQTIAIVMVSHDLGTISSYVKSIACVNRTLHLHPSNRISVEQLAAYDCPIQLLKHGEVPHTVLLKH